MIVSEFAIEHALASPNVSGLFWRENTPNLNKQLSIVARVFINKGFSAFTAVVRPLAETCAIWFVSSIVNCFKLRVSSRIFSGK